MKTTADLYERCAQLGPDRLAFRLGSESRTYGLPSTVVGS